MIEDMAATSTSWVNYEKIEQEADLIRKKHGFESAPVDPYAVASRLGFRVRIATFKSPDLAGQVSNRSGLFVIDVSLNDSSLRQRFTVAHEIGHAVLHLSDKVGAFVDSQATFSRTVFQVLDNPLPKTDTREIEANRFAAALLMPKQLLTEAVQISQYVPELARRFQVSQLAMQTRLTSLKIS